MTTGQAGQTIQCSCGERFEIPSIRKLRGFPPAEDEPLVPLWTKRQGLLFLGSLITLCAAGFAAVIWLNLPAPFIPPAIDFDQSAVEKEVQALSPGEAFRRFALIRARLPKSFEERVQTKSVPPFLLISESPLLEFEANGPGPMAPKQMGIIWKEVSKYDAQIKANASVRETLFKWLWVAGAVGVGGILVVCSAFFLVRSGKPSNRRQSTRQVA